MNRIAEGICRGKGIHPLYHRRGPDRRTKRSEAVLAMEKAGADLIELGIPFSDPTAEGPVIQGANLRALAGGVTTDGVFGW